MDDLFGMNMDPDFDGLTDYRAESECEQQQAIVEILEILDRGERLNSGQMCLLRWFCGVPAPEPPKEQMAVWPSEGDPF